MEYIDILDENGLPIGEIKDRDEVHKLGLWHREVHVWVINDKREFLMQKRSPNKKIAPNKWSICAGHVEAGDTSLQTAMRELEEEVGISLPENEFKFLISFKFPNHGNNGVLINNCITDVYIVKANLDISKCKIQEEEVSEIKYVYYLDIDKGDDFIKRDEEYKRILYSKVDELF